MSSCELNSSAILDQYDCIPPCWEGVTPGQTTSSNAFRFLSELTEINQSSLTRIDNENGEGYYAWHFINRTAEDYGRAYFYNDFIYIIDIDLKRKLPLSRFIEEFGEPNIVIPHSCWAETKWEHIAIIYQDMGIALVSFDPWVRPESSSINIQPNFKIEEVFYFDPPSFFEPGTFYKISDSPDIELVQENSQDWHGYGIYNYFECE